MSDEPPVLPVGTAVSAKYKGAFCEAKVSRVFTQLKYRVSYKEPYTGTDTLNEEQIRKTNVPIRVGRTVLAWHHVHKTYVDAQITRIQDQSQYTVVFDDGDITTLRRNSLCLKSGRHFNESETLDQLPLTHPEHFSNPVVGGRSRRRNRNREDDSDGEHEEVDPEMEGYSSEVGRVVMGENLEKKRSKDWPPGLIMLPKNPKVLNTKEEFLIRSFKDDRFYNVPKKDVIEFDRNFGERLEKTNTPFYHGVQKALRYLNTGELPPNWEKDFFHSDRFETDPELNFSDSSDDEPCEEKDRFVAQLYKFLDEAGTPLNKTPTIGGEDVDLYRLFSVVNKLGGYNKVSNHNKWKTVMGRLKYGNGQSVTNQVKQVYKKCLLSFEAFYKTLGVTMLNHTKPSKKNKGRSLIRDKDRATPINSPKPEKDEDSQDRKDSEREQQQQQQQQTLSLSLQSEDCNNREKSKRRSDILRDEAAKKKSSQEIGEGGTGNAAEVSGVATSSELTSSSSSLSEPGTSGVASGRPKRSTEVRSWAKEKKAPKTGAVEKVKALVEKFEDQGNKKEEEKEKGQQTRSKSQLLPKSQASSTTSDNKKQDVVGVRESSNSATRDVRPSQASKTKKGGAGSGADEDNNKTKKLVRKRSYLESEGSSDTNAAPIATAAPSHGINVGDKLKVYYGTTIDSKITYEAKVVEIDRDGSVPLYLVHYTGWNTRYDEWINPGRVAENLSAATKAKRLKNAASAAPKTASSVLSSNSAMASAASQTTAPPSKTSAATAAAAAARRKRNASTTRRTSINNELPRSTTPSSSTSNSSRPKTPATPATRSTTRSARQEQKRTRRISVQTDTSVHSDSESPASESEPELTRTRSGGGKSDEPELRTYKKRLPRSPPNKSRAKQLQQQQQQQQQKEVEDDEDEDTEREEETSKVERPKRTRKLKRGVAPDKMADEESDDENVSVNVNCQKGRDFDLNQIRSELKGFSKGEKSIPVSATSDSADKDTSSDDCAKSSSSTVKIHVTAEADEEEEENDDEDEEEEDFDEENKEIDVGPPRLDVKPDDDPVRVVSPSAPKLTAVVEDVPTPKQTVSDVSSSVRTIQTLEHTPKSIGSVVSPTQKTVQSCSSAPIKTISSVGFTPKTILGVSPAPKTISPVSPSPKTILSVSPASKTIQSACAASKSSKSILLPGTSAGVAASPSKPSLFDDDDVYEFKETEPFEFEDKSKMSKRLPRFYDTDDVGKKTAALPFRSPVRMCGYDEEDEDVEVEDVVVMGVETPKKLDPFDKLVESPSFNIVKTSPEKSSERLATPPHHKPSTPIAVDKVATTTLTLTVAPPLKPTTTPIIPVVSAPAPSTPSQLSALYRETTAETSDDCSRDNMELSDTESQTQPIFNISSGVPTADITTTTVTAAVATEAPSPSRSEEAFSDTFTKSSSGQNTLMDMEDKMIGEEDEIKASIRRVIEQTTTSSSSMDDDTRDAVLQVTLPTACYQPKRSDVPSASRTPRTIISSSSTSGVVKASSDVVETPEKCAFSILNRLSPPPSRPSDNKEELLDDDFEDDDKKSDPSLLQAIDKESQKLLEDDKKETNMICQVVGGATCATIIPKNLDYCFGKMATKAELKQEEVKKGEVIEEEKVALDEKKMIIDETLKPKLELATSDVSVAKIPSEVNEDAIGVFGAETSAVVEPKKRRKVLSRPYVESDTDSSSDSDNLVIARSDEEEDEESRTNSAPDDKEAKSTWTGDNNESSSSSSLSPRPIQALPTSDVITAAVAPAPPTIEKEQQRNFKFDADREEKKSFADVSGDEASLSSSDCVDKTKKEEDSRLHSMLLCEETIPRSPAPPSAEETVASEEPTRRSKSVLEMPFASVPGSSNNNNSKRELLMNIAESATSVSTTESVVKQGAGAGMTATPPTSPESTVSNASPRDNNGGLSPDSRDLENTNNTYDAFQHQQQQQQQQKTLVCTTSKMISSYSEDDSSQMACDRSKKNEETANATSASVGAATSNRKRRRSYRGAEASSAASSKRGRRLAANNARSRHNNSDTEEEEEDDVSEHSMVVNVKASSPYNRGNRSERPLKYDFRPNLEGVTDKNERINLIMQKITELRKVYADLKAELSDIERRKKKMKKRQREALKTVKQVASCA